MKRFAVTVGCAAGPRGGAVRGGSVSSTLRDDSTDLRWQKTPTKVGIPWCFILEMHYPNRQNRHKNEKLQKIE